MNFLKLAVGWLSLLAEAWMSFLFAAIFVWAAAGTSGGEALTYRILAGIQATCALLIVLATWHERTHPTQRGTS